MNRKHRQAPRLEPLEGKQLLTTLHAAPAFSDVGTLRMPVISVTNFTANTNSYGSFKLSGRLGNMGNVTGAMIAQLDPTTNKMTSGQMVLANRRGSVTYAMSYDPTDTTSYDYTIVSGTGSFAAASGSGKMSTSGLSANARTMSFHVSMD